LIPAAPDQEICLSPDSMENRIPGLVELSSDRRT
jgi:hypothetical protein